MSALAPDISIQAVPQGNPETQVQLVLEVSGGRYDVLEHSWRDDSRRVQSQVFDDRAGTSPLWTRPNPASGHDDWITITCDITVRGTGSNADANTSDTATATERARVFFKPAADAPSVDILHIPDGFERTTLALEAAIGRSHIGNYDTLTYLWTCTRRGSSVDIAPTTFDDVTSRTPMWTRPEVNANTLYDIRCSLTGGGSNVHALINSTEETHADQATTVQNFPNADAPTPTHIQHNESDRYNESQWFASAGSGQEGDDINLRVLYDDRTGHFDRLTYLWEWKWHSQAENEWTSIGTEKDIVWTRPNTAARQQYDIRATITAHGDDVNASIGTTNSKSIVSDETALYINPLPGARAPSWVWVESQHPDGTWHRDAFGGLENGTVNLRMAVAQDALYDSIKYKWTITDWDGNDITTSFVDTPDQITAVITRPTVTQNEYIQVRASVIVTGNDTFANAGTEDTHYNETPMFVQNLPPVRHPSIRLQYGAQTAEGGQSTGIGVEINAANDPGAYDYLTWHWEMSTNNSINPEFASQYLDALDQRTTTWHRYNETGSDRIYWFRVTVTAHGSDINYDSNSTSVHSILFDSRVTPQRVALAPSALAILGIHDGYEGTRVTLRAGNNADGHYDRLEYQWNIDGVDISQDDIPGFPKQITITRPPVQNTRDIPVTVTMTARGDGTNARPESVAVSGPVSSVMRVLPARETNLSMIFIDPDGNAQEITHAEIIDEEGYVHPPIRFLFVDNAQQAREIFNSGS